MILFASEFSCPSDPLFNIVIWIYYTSKNRKCEQNSIAKITGKNLFVFLPCNLIQYKNQDMAPTSRDLYNGAQTKHISYRSNCAENSGSHLNSDDKQREAELVLRWETARESSGDDGFFPHDSPVDRKSTRLNSSHSGESRMPSSA